MPLTRARTLDKESDILSRVYSDIDNYRRFYSIKESHPDEEIFIQFVAPKLFLFEEYRFPLLQASEIKPLSPDYYYRPDYVSYEEYGTINLWAMLLYINDIPTLEDFTVDTIKIPSKKAISKLIDGASVRKTLKEIVPLHELPLKPTPPLYSSKKVIPRAIEPQVIIPPFTPTDVYFKREFHTIDIIMARNRYIDLEVEPVGESIILNVNGQPNFLKGKHYELIKGPGGINRLTWDPRRISGGIGLVDVLVEEISFEVEYARKVR